MTRKKLLVWVAPMVVASVVLLLGLGTAQAGRSVSASPVKGQARTFVAPNVGVGGMKITGSLVAAGFSGAAATAGGFTAVDSAHTLKCKPIGGCTFEANMDVQFVEPEGAFAICFKVDGTYATCPYLGIDTGTNFFRDESTTQHLSGLTQGNHTVQTFLFTSAGTTIYNYDITYRAYNA